MVDCGDYWVHPHQPPQHLIQRVCHPLERRPVLRVRTPALLRQLPDATGRFWQHEDQPPLGAPVALGGVKGRLDGLGEGEEEGDVGYVLRAALWLLRGAVL